MMTHNVESMLHEIKILKQMNYELQKENTKLIDALHEQRKIIWMAAEYAKDAKLFAPFMVNKAIDALKNCGIYTNCKYVKDKIIGNWKSYI